MQTFCRLHSTLSCKAQCTKAAYLTLQWAFFQRKNNSFSFYLSQFWSTQTAFPTAYFLDKKHLLNRRLHTLTGFFFFFFWPNCTAHCNWKCTESFEAGTPGNSHQNWFLSVFQISHSWAAYSPSSCLQHSSTKNKRNHSGHSGKLSISDLSIQRSRESSAAETCCNSPRLIKSKISECLDIPTL